MPISTFFPLGGAGGGSGTGKKAATLIVGASLLEADYTDIQSALDNLPARGGTIFVREGTYSPSTTYTLPNTNVTFQAAGRGDQFTGGASAPVIIDLGVNPFAAFSAPVAAGNVYKFDGITLRGQFGAGQHGVNNAGDLNTYWFENSVFQGLDLVFNDTSGFGIVCKLIGCDSGDPTFSGVNGVFNATAVASSILEVCRSVINVIGATCIGARPSLIMAESTIQNLFFAPRNTIDVAGFEVTDSLIGSSDIVVNSFGETTKVHGGTFNDSSVALTVGDKAVIDGSIFRDQGGVPVSLSVSTGYNAIKGNIFAGAAQGMTFQTAGAIRNVANSNTFQAVAVPVTEVAPADFNLFSDNNGWGASVVVGASSFAADNIP
jgi:hypothetical protein